ncbi:MAG TPA: aspartate kinase [Gelria sp.]|nr:aspartate kinase [Gelria sp.]
MGLIVCKFGGSSVAGIDKINKVASRIKSLQAEGYGIVVVVSAMGDTTDELLKLATGIGNNLNLREMDALLATGEQQSAALLALALDKIGCKAISLTGWQAGVKSNSNYSKAKISGIDKQRMEKELTAGKIVVVAGFQGLSADGDVTTLGRGGSDTSAVAIAASLGAKRCMIFTDVDGVYTADPRIVKEAQKLPSITYEEMLEMASLGAVIIQPRAVEFAMLYGVDIEVLNSFSLEPGTIITEVTNMEQHKIVTGVAHDCKCAKIGIFDVPDKPGIAGIIFSALARAGVNVDMVIQSAMREERNDIAFTICSDDLHLAVPVVEEVVKEIGASGMSYGDNVAKVSIIGAGMQSNPGVAAAMFEVLATENINIQMISTSEIKVSCIINEDDVETAIKALHRKFKLNQIND